LRIGDDVFRHGVEEETTKRKTWKASETSRAAAAMMQGAEL
jgi:hypothetical protein